MAGNNHVFLLGNVVQPPYFDRVGERRRPFLRLYLAVDRPRDRGADFVRVVAYDEVALWYPHLQPGKGVALPGYIRTRKIQKRGERDTVVEVVAGGFAPLDKIDWQDGHAFRQEILAELGVSQWLESPVNNHVALVGNLTRDPRYDLVERGSRPALPTLCAYVAVDRPGGGADFVRVVAFGELARLSFPYLQAGSGVLTTGRLQVRKFEKGGRRRTVVEVVADNLKFLSGIKWEEGDGARERILAERAQDA
jgi:single-stranded DNA-binding protein